MKTTLATAIALFISLYFSMPANAQKMTHSPQNNLPKLDTLSLTIDDRGQTFIKEKLVKQSEIIIFLQNFYQAKPNGIVLVAAQGAVKYNQIVEILKLIQEAGGGSVAFSYPLSESASPPEYFTINLKNQISTFSDPPSSYPDLITPPGLPPLPPTLEKRVMKKG